jgi:uncharacterized membrane protein YoaK (UPF0700 family)
MQILIMIHKIKNKLAILSAAFFMMPILTAAVATAASSDINNSLCTGTNIRITTNPGSDSDSCKNTTNNADKIAGHLVKKIINLLSAVVGILAVIMIIVAGFRYITSGGRDEAVKGAKNTILYAIVGLVVVALAQIIVHFVLAKTHQASTP